MNISKIIKISIRIFLALVITSTTFSFHSYDIKAWEQGESYTHEEINKQAVTRFLKNSLSNPKYAGSPIDTAQTYWGTVITSTSLAEAFLKTKRTALLFKQWVIEGGFSADEPNVWACVRHFYDPLSVNGVPQLTDHYWLHSWAYPTISAKQWAFEDKTNPFSWSKALEYYKQAMEISDNSQIKVITGTGDRDPDVEVVSAAETRNAYLAKSFRALGETMHMMADITQPSHVRNDSHPNMDTDPVESTVTGEIVKLVKDSPVVPVMEDAINSAADVADMYEKIAKYTNSNFYTDDSIYDQASGVMPTNWEKPYPHPQFSDLTLDQESFCKTYYKVINGERVYMIQQTYVSWKFDRAPVYYIPPSFAKDQAGVLVPIAIKANTRLIDSFFPTLELSFEVKEKKDAALSDDQDYREFSVVAQMKHLLDKDVEWKTKNLEIKYTGPAELWGESKGKARKIADLQFKEGVPVNPMTVFVGDAKYARADKFQIKSDDTIYVVINAGGRNFKSSKYIVSAKLVQVTIDPQTLKGELDTKYTFSAKAEKTPSGAYYVWYLDNKESQNGKSNQFVTSFSGERTYNLKVKLLDSNERELGSAEAEVNIGTVVEQATGNLAQLQQLRYIWGKTGDAVYKFDSFDINQGEISENHYLGLNIYTDRGNPEITWNGASFSGRSIDTNKNTGGVTTTEIKGTVSPDGQVLESFMYSYSLKNSYPVSKNVITVSNAYSFTIKNAVLTYQPLHLNGGNLIVDAISKTPPAVTLLEEEYVDSTLHRKDTLTLSEWTPNSENILQFTYKAK